MNIQKLLKTIFEKTNLATIFLLSLPVNFMLWLLGYTIVPFNLLAWHILLAIFLSVVTVKEFLAIRTSTQHFTQAILPIIAFFYILFRATVYNFSGSSQMFIYFYHAIFVFLCSLTIFYFYQTEKIAKIVGIFLYSVFLSLVTCTIFIIVCFSDWGAETVVYSCMSPNSLYLAEIIDYDAGALGGSTEVVVTSQAKHDINLLIIKLHKDNTQTVYSGKWGEFNYMKIFWESDYTLNINGMPYQIK